MDDVPARIDHTVLGPTTTPADVEAAVAEAAALGTNVCVPACYVDRARAQLTAELDGAAASRDDAHRLVTVIGFPHGQHETAALREEAELAVDAGADELDVVANAGQVLAGEADRVRASLEVVVDAVSVPVKAIVCAPMLDREGLERACEAAEAAGCSHVKTATGFNEGGATVEDVQVMKEYLPVKASGGIGSWERAREFFEAGATRIGASSGDVIVAEWREATDAE